MSGCAVIHAVDSRADAYQKKALDSWVGADRATVRAKWGEPQVITPDKAGGEVWTYLQTDTGVVNGQPWSTTTSTSFTFNGEGRVVSWRKA